MNLGKIVINFFLLLVLAALTWVFYQRIDSREKENAKKKAAAFERSVEAEYQLKLALEKTPSEDEKKRLYAKVAAEALIKAIRSGDGPRVQEFSIKGIPTEDLDSQTKTELKNEIKEAGIESQFPQFMEGSS